MLLQQAKEGWNRLRWTKELDRVQTLQVAPGRLRPAPAQLVARTGYNTVVWALDVPGQAPRYMRLTRFGGEDVEQAHVVHVDALLFYGAMLRRKRYLRRTTHGHDCMAITDMRRDYKYPAAEAGFERACSINDAVPLADPVVGLDHDGQLAVDFINGITRTYWLLVNDVPSFPVRVSNRKDAYLLAQFAGVGLASYRTLFS